MQDMIGNNTWKYTSSLYDKGGPELRYVQTNGLQSVQNAGAARGGRVS